MLTKTEKKNAIRQEIIDAAVIYSQNLAGKVFLYVYGNEFFEVSFPTDHFLHLTGVETSLSAKEFYKNAKKMKLTNNQFYFTARHSYANAKKKLPCLKRLPELTNDIVCVLKDMQTVSIVYKLSVTNLEFTLGLVENTDTNGNKVNNLFLPMSLRVEDSSIAKSKNLQKIPPASPSLSPTASWACAVHPSFLEYPSSPPAASLPPRLPDQTRY